MKSLSLGLFAASLSLLVGCSDSPPPSPPPVETPVSVSVGWKAKVGFEAGFRVAAVAEGQLAAHPGRELVAVGEGVVVAWEREGTWKTEVVPAGEGPLHGVLIADVDPSREGVEIVVVGETPDGRGRAELLSWTSSGWRMTRMIAPPEPLQAVGLLEGALCVVGKSVSLVQLREGRWSGFELAKLPSPGKSLRGIKGRLFVGCVDGELLELSAGIDASEPQERDRRVAARNAIASAGGHLLTADGDGTLALLPKAGGSGLPDRHLSQDRVEVYRSPRALTGALLAELNPDAAGLELVACGEAGELVLLSADDEGRFEAKSLLRGLSPLRGLLKLSGRRLVTAAESGTVTLVEYR